MRLRAFGRRALVMGLFVAPAGVAPPVLPLRPVELSGESAGPGLTFSGAFDPAQQRPPHHHRLRKLDHHPRRTLQQLRRRERCGVGGFSERGDGAGVNFTPDHHPR